MLFYIKKDLPIGIHVFIGNGMGRKKTFPSQKANDLIQIGLGQKLETFG